MNKKRRRGQHSATCCLFSWNRHAGKRIEESAVIRGRFVRKSDENMKTLQSLDTSTQKPALLVTDEIVLSCPSSPETKSGVSSLVTEEEKWFDFTRHRRRKVVCLRLSSTTDQCCVVAITNEEKKCDFVYHELWNTGVFAHYQQRKNGVSSFITYDGKTVCSPITSEETVVSSFITNEWAAMCLRLSPTMEKCCVSACHEGRKE